MALDLSRDEVQFLLGASHQDQRQNHNLTTTRSILASSRRAMTSRHGRLTGRSTARSTARSTENNTGRSTANKMQPLVTVVEDVEDVSTDFLDASEVQSYGASLKYMRPYWKRHVGPLLSRLEIHAQPGKDFVTRVRWAGGGSPKIEFECPN